MACSIDKNLQLQLIGFVANELSQLAKVPETVFNINDYVRSFNTRAIQRGLSTEKALEYSQFIPTAVRKSVALGDGAIMDIVDTKALRVLEKQFSTLEGVNEYLNPVVDTTIVEETLESITADEQKPDTTHNTLDPEERTKEAETNIRFVAKQSTARSVTGQQSEQNPDGSWSNIKKESENFYYDFYNVFTEAVELYDNIPGSQVEINGHKGFKLSIIRKNQVDKKYIKQSEKDFLEGKLGFTPEKAAELFNNGVGAYVTDNDSNILYFDENYNVVGSEKGMPIYHNIRNVTLENGIYIASGAVGGGSLMNIANLAKNLGVSLERATEIRQLQLKDIYDIRQYLAADSKNTISTEITGVSKGIMDVRLGQDTPSTQIEWDKSDLKFEPRIHNEESADGKKKSGMYIDVPRHRPIPIQENNISNEDAQKITSLLFDNIKLESGTPVPNSTKRALATSFIYDHSGSVQVLNNEKGYAVYFKGRKVNLENPLDVEQAKADIIKHLTTKYTSKKGVINLKYNINDGRYKFDNANIGKDFTTFNITDGILTTKDIPYYEFVKQNSALKIEPNKDNTLIFLNGYFTFKLTKESKEKLASKPVEMKEIPSTPADIESSKTEIDPMMQVEEVKKVDRSKLFRGKGLEMSSTPKQMAAAKKWFENSPLSKHVGYTEMFDVINSDAWAEFSNGAIKLYAGADHTALYHEAWHAFSQHFLTKSQKKKLYEEVSKTREGKLALKKMMLQKHTKSLSPYYQALAVEELIAEDFRQYMLSDGKKIMGKSPARNSIFRRILNFLKRVIGSITGRSVTDTSAHGLETLYRQLRVGKLRSYSPSAKNASFTEGPLFKTIDPIEGQSTEINDQDAMLVVESIDSLISQYADEQNAIEGNTMFSSVLFTKPEILLPEIMGAVKNKFIQKYNENTTALETAEGLAKENLLKQSALLKDAIINWGELDGDTGVIAFWMEKSPYISEQTKLIDKDRFAKTQEDVDATRFDKSGNDLSMMDLASNQVLHLIKSLKDYDADGSPTLNSLGFEKLSDYRLTWRKLINALTDENSSPQEMIAAMNKVQSKEPWVSDLLSKLGPVDTATGSSFDLWTNFWQAFYMADWALYQVSVNELSEKRDGDGTILREREWEITTGYASAVFRQVEQDFKSHFKGTHAIGSYIKDSKSIGNVLDYAVLDKYKGKLKGSEFNFLKDIGFPLVDNIEIRKGLKDVNVGYLYTKLDKLARLKVPITDVVKALKDVHTFESGTIPSETSNVNKILNLHAKNSGLYANTAVSTADGNTKYEQTQMSTLSVMQQAINKASSFPELIAQPHMAHLRYENNPAIKASVWMKSLFEFNPETQTFGAKKAGVKFMVDDLSGTQTIIDGSYANLDYSSSTAKSDRYTRLLQDIYGSLKGGRFSTMVHADKSTTLSMRVTNLNVASSKVNHLYVDNASFTDSAAMINTFNILLPHVNAELERINKVKAGEEVSHIPGYTVKNGKGIVNGTEFAIFDDIFSSDTKKALKEVGSTKNLPVELKTAMQAEMTEYFKWSTANTEKALGGMMFVDASIHKALNKETNSKLTKDQAKRIILGSYTVNSFIHHVESLAVVYGDLAQYNMLKEEFHKRNAGVASTGRMFRTDQAAIDHVNNVLGRPFTKKSGITTQPFNGQANTAILKENTLPSKMVPEYHKAIVEQLINQGMSKKDASDKATHILEPYNKMDEGDAQGWLSFDSYRILGKLEGKWSRAQEVLFQKIINDEPVTMKDTAEYFPPRKYQYFGPLEAKGVSATAFHKYSLFPMIPSVIKGKNLEILHKNMMEQNIDYAVFDSGSKVSTITAEGRTEGDILYSDLENRTMSTDTQYTKNTIHLNYLKDQLDINSKFKGKVIFSTQLRKLIEEGLIEGGVPVDYMPGKNFDARRKAWDSEKNKSQSAMYNLYTNYESKIAKLIEFRKAELRNEVGWTEQEMASGKGKMEKLVKFIQADLDSQDLADHEIDFIKVNSSGKLVHDLSISLSANKIERSLNAIVNNRLVRQKVNGEALVQLAGSMFEASNPTAEEKAEWKTNDLKSYRKGEDGKTLPMDVKVALQGNFEQLHNLIHKDEEKVAVYNLKEITTHSGETKTVREIDQAKTIARLNEMIQDPEWRAVQSNMDLITMVGVRIPVQGLNSMEFMAVWEFLPQEAGNVIIPPSEIVAKSGSDFDIDKLTIMMPNSALIGGKPEVIAEIESLKNQGQNIERMTAISAEIKKLRDEKKTINKIEEPSEVQVERNRVILDEIAELTREKNGLDGKAIENSLMFAIRNILELPHNFVSLITPNDTNLVVPIAKRLSKNRSYKATEAAHSKSTKVSSTRVLEPAYNIYKHESNAVGKETLGQGAIDNTFNTVFNRVGAYMNPEYFTDRGVAKRADILMNHNKQEVLKGKYAGEKAISLSHLYDVNDEHKIADVINQLMNGWLDVAKDAWIFDIQGNKQVVPVIMFLLQAGVPLEETINFVSNPLIKEYVKQQKAVTSVFARPNGKAPEEASLYRFQAKDNVFHMIGMGELKGKKQYDTTVSMTKGLNFSELAADIANISLADAVVNNNAKAAFLHYLELEELSKGIRDIKMKLSYDTSKSTTLFDAQKSEASLAQLRAETKIPNEIVDKILDESPIGSFRVAPFQLELWGPLFKLRNHNTINDFLIEKLSDMTQQKKMAKAYPDQEVYVEQFKNDFIVKIFTDEIKKFDISDDTYRGLSTKTESKIKDANLPQRGIAVVANEKGELVVHLDQAVLDKHFSNNEFSEYAELAPIPVEAFKGGKANKSEFYRFSIEREYLRATKSFAEVSNTDYFLYKANKNSESLDIVEDETADQFKDRVLKTTYEEFLRDEALDNTLNYWKMFNSKSTVADKLFEMRDMHPTLATNYSIINDLIISQGGKVEKDGTRKDPYTNLALRDPKVSKDFIEIYHKNIKELSNAQNTLLGPEVSEIERERIAKFFDNLPLTAFLQSGMNAADSLSMVRVMPTEKIAEIIGTIIPKITTELKEGSYPLDDFYRKFNQHNDFKNISIRRRLKNYVSQAEFDFQRAQAQTESSTDVQEILDKKSDLVEFQLEIPQSELAKARERLTCKI